MFVSFIGYQPVTREVKVLLRGVGLFSMLFKLKKGQDSLSFILPSILDIAHDHCIAGMVL